MLLSVVVFLIFVKTVCSIFGNKNKFNVFESLERDDSVFIAVMTDGHLAEANEYGYTTWYSQLKKQNLISDVQFFGDRPRVEGEWSHPFIKVPKMKDASKYRLVSRFLFSIQYFLENTSSSWLVRVTEDVSINSDAFHLFLEDLKTLPDPYTTFTVQGSCLNRDGSFYLQGGSGFLVSRAAAAMIYLHSDELLRQTNTIRSDDILISRFIALHGVDGPKATNIWFQGHSFDSYPNASVALASLHKVPTCPDLRLMKSQCKKYLAKVNQIVFWHDRSRTLDFLRESTKLRKSIPEDIFYYVKDRRPSLCRLGGPTDNNI